MGVGPFLGWTCALLSQGLKSMSFPFLLSLRNIHEDNEVGNGEKSLEKSSNIELDRKVFRL